MENQLIVGNLETATSKITQGVAYFNGSEIDRVSAEKVEAFDAVFHGMTATHDGYQAIDLIELPSGVRIFNTLVFPNGKIRCDRIEFPKEIHQGEKHFNVVFYPDGSETRERIETLEKVFTNFFSRKSLGPDSLGLRFKVIDEADACKLVN